MDLRKDHSIVHAAEGTVVMRREEGGKDKEPDEPSGMIYLWINTFFIHYINSLLCTVLATWLLFIVCKGLIILLII